MNTFKMESSLTTSQISLETIFDPFENFAKKSRDIFVSLNKKNWIRIGATQFRGIWCFLILEAYHLLAPDGLYKHFLATVHFHLSHAVD